MALNASVLLFFVLIQRVRHLLPRKASKNHEHASNLPNTDTVVVNYDGAKHGEELAGGCDGNKRE